MKWDFTGKTVLVVGGTSGINRGIANEFAEAGANVGVISRSTDKVNDTVQELASLGEGGVCGETADVRDYDALNHAVGVVVEQLGKLNVVISGAAGNFPALAEGLSPNGFKSVMDIDLLGTFHVMKAVYPHLLKPGAAIVNISAPQSLVPMLGQVHVCAAKAGVDMITRTLAMEWGAEGVRINSVIPGPVEGTEGMKRLAPTDDMMRACAQSVPLKRLATPSDIAHACLFLCSPFASYINGSVLPVDGGWNLGGYSAVGAGMEPLLRSLVKKK